MSRTIWWEDNQVKMIDQRILPLHYEILSYADYRDVAAAITDMVVRGAPAIGAAGGYGMALAAQQSPARDRDSLLGDLAAAQAVLDASRPTAVNLSWATARDHDPGAASSFSLTLRFAQGRRGRYALGDPGRGAAHRGRGCGDQPAHGRVRRRDRAAGGRTADGEHPDALQRRLAGHGGLRHHAGGRPRGHRGGQAGSRVGG